MTVEIHIDELHIHYPEGVEGEPDVVSGSEDVGGSEPASDSRTVNQPSGQQYDIRDKPLRGLILHLLGQSDGATRAAIANELNIKQSTVDSQLAWFTEDTGVVDSFEHDGKTYYKLNEIGIRVLAKYEQRWSNGYKNLPANYWDGLVTPK